MAASFQITATGAAPIEAKLAALVEAFGDLTPLMETLGRVLENQVNDRFDSETGPDGKRWKPSTRAKIDGRKTLTDRSILRGTIHSVAGPRSVAVGTNLVYAGIHQFGGTIRPKNGKALHFKLPGKLGWRTVSSVTMPARPFLGLSPDNADELLDEVEGFLADRMGGAE